LRTVFEREPQDAVDRRKAQAGEPILRDPSPGALDLNLDPRAIESRP
jgi:hypothetical protein